LWFRVSLYHSDGHVNSDKLDHVLEEADTAMKHAITLLGEFPGQGDVQDANEPRSRPLPTTAAIVRRTPDNIRRQVDPGHAVISTEPGKSS
jgi:hypothetical protein